MMTLAAMARLGGLARSKKLSAEQRSAIGRLGGQQRARNLTPEQRRQSGLKAIRTRRRNERKLAALKASKNERHVVSNQHIPA